MELLVIKKTSELFDLSGKVAIVTGGAQGIGQGIAMRLGDAGANVVVADINLETASKTAEEMKAAGYKAKAEESDVSKVADAEKTVKEAVAAFGDLNILINNAGIFTTSPAVDMTEGIWDRMLDINLKGTMFFSQAAARAMRDKGHGGKIINIASVNAFHPASVALPHYCASKGGVVMLTKALAKEWAPMGILVNAIAPATIQTPGRALFVAAGLPNMTKKEIEAAVKAFIARIPAGYLGEPDDVARVALFLASEASDYIVGETIVTDGGYLLG